MLRMGWRSRICWMAMWTLLGCARSAAGLASGVDNAMLADAGDSEAGADPAPLVDAGKQPGPDPEPMPTDDGGSEGGSQDAGTAPTCAAQNMCASARGLSSVAGDTGSDTSMASGMRSEWLSVTVTDTTLTGSSLGAKLTLTSNGGANYDLFVLKPSDSGGSSSAPRDCGATPMGSQNASGTDTVSLDWDDQTNNLGETAGDGLVLSLEVRHVSGPCGSWSLLVQGNP